MAIDPLHKEALDWLLKWHGEGVEAGLSEPDAAVLATSDRSGYVTARVVLVRKITESGLVFFTNGRSLKGRQLAENPRAALCFYWDGPNYQARVEGPVEAVTASESDDYWATRPWESQLGSYVSRQSEPLASREVLEQACVATAQEFLGKPIPRPPHWGGYRVIPHSFEFFIGRAGRLHDRTHFERTESGWTKQLLYP